MNRNLGGGGNEEVPVLEGIASMAGYELIELMWTKNGRSRNGSVGRVHCFDVPVSSGRRKMKLDDGDAKLKIISGITRFYPDGNNYNWGYVVDTENNRRKLANSFKTGWFKIMNVRIRDEIKELADEMGLSTSKLDKPTVNIKKTVREIKADEGTRKVQKELDESNKRMCELEELIIKMQEDGEAKLTAPLAGVKVKMPVVTEGKELSEMNRPELVKYITDKKIDIKVIPSMKNVDVVEAIIKLEEPSTEE